MDTIQAIMTRSSVRAYTDEKISDENVRIVLEAAMSGPSCTNARDWAFIVVRDRETLNKMADSNGRPAQPLRGADMGILITGDTGRAYKGAPDYWIIDGAIAGQNMVLAAKALGIGSVWLGTYPEMDRVQGLKEFFALPENIVPHSIIAFGYEAEDTSGRPKAEKFYEPDRVHMEKW